MEDATKASARSLDWYDSDYFSAQPKTDPDQYSPPVPEPAVGKPQTTDEKALARWFFEQRGNKRIRKRLNITNECQVTSAGPLNMTGNITLVKEDGSVEHTNSLTLCRCGASKNTPFCDDQHLDIEFFDGGAVNQFSSTMPVRRPQNITVTCVKNGPLKYHGYLRVFNKKGQEYISTSGSLCRCGKSSKKPFCDSSNGGCCNG